MAGRCTRGWIRTTATRTIKLAKMLKEDCSNLLKLYIKKEGVFADVTVADDRLVSIPPPSSQLDTRDKFWCLHSALLQCCSLLERAIAKEEEELGGGRNDEYQQQRKKVMETLKYVQSNTGELLKAVDGMVVPEGFEFDRSTTLFDLKLWIYRVFIEVDYWTEMTITTLQALPSVTVKERVRTTPVSSMRSARR